MRRRDFLGIAASAIFAPVFGQWYRQRSGIIVREEGLWKPDVVRTGVDFVDYYEIARFDLAERLKRNIDAELTAMLGGL